MVTRWHMENESVMVEHCDRTVLEAIRRTDARFKRRRIQSVLQAYPSRVEVGVVYELDSKPPKPADGLTASEKGDDDNEGL